MPNKDKGLASVGFLREAFMVKRYHTVPHLAITETVGHHTCNVMALLFFLFDDHPPLYLVRHALHHDAAELVTGDIPATAKWRFSSLAKAVEAAEHEVAEAVNLENAELEPLHRDILKYADIMDLCFKSVEEIASGNLPFTRILSNGVNYARALLEGSLKSHNPSQQLWLILCANEYVAIKSFISLENNDVKH